MKNIICTLGWHNWQTPARNDLTLRQYCSTCGTTKLQPADSLH